MNYMNARNCMPNMNSPQTRQNYTSMNTSSRNSTCHSINTTNYNMPCTSANTNNCTAPAAPANTNNCNNTCTSVNPNTCNTSCASAISAVQDTGKSANGTKRTSDCCPETVYTRECPVPEIPTGNQRQLFHFINEVSFAAYEAFLFLDTHPDDRSALAYFHKYNQLRNTALKEYAKHYGPLTISTADDCSSKCWEWMNQPWPWEGGFC